MGNKDIGMPITHNKESPSIRHLCKSDESLRIIISHIGDIEYSPHKDGFAFMVDTIIGQMLSTKVADIISERLRCICIGDISPEVIDSLSIGDLQKIGLSAAKSEYIIGLAAHCCSQPNYFSCLSSKPDNEVMKELMKLRGIGAWSAKMYLIFVLDRPDVLPFEDGAFKQAFKWLYPAVAYTEKSVREKCECWQPFASIASRYLYKALDSGLTKRPFADLVNAVMV